MPEALPILPKSISEKEVWIMRLPSLFSHFHYITIAREHTKIYVFQQYGKYEIPVIRFGLDLFHQIKTNLDIIRSRHPTDDEIMKLIQFEQKVYGLDEDLLDRFLVKNALNRLISDHSDMKWNEEYLNEKDMIQSFLESTEDIETWCMEYTQSIIPFFPDKSVDELLWNIVNTMKRLLYSHRSVFYLRQGRYLHKHTDIIRQAETISMTRYRLKRYSSKKWIRNKLRKSKY